MVVVTPLTAIIVTYLICIKLYERHPHTSSLKYCIMPEPFPAEQFGKGSRYARLVVTGPRELFLRLRFFVLIV